MSLSLADPRITEAFDEGVEFAPPSPRIGAWCVKAWNPTPDPSWQKILTALAGRNFFGDPMLRIVNGSARLELMGGIWENNELEDAGLPSIRYQWDQRYSWLEEFWIVEEWIRPRHTREEWEAKERKWEDGVSYLEHPIFPERGSYRYHTHFRRTILGIEIPEEPTTTGLRTLASRWLRLREAAPPPEWEETWVEQKRRIAGNIRVARERRLLREKEAKAAKRDIWENEVGGLTGYTPRIALTGLDVPKA